MKHKTFILEGVRGEGGRPERNRERDRGRKREREMGESENGERQKLDLRGRY